MRKGNVASGQDWEPQVFNFQKKGGAGANNGGKEGKAGEAQKKEFQRANQQSASPGANAKKLDEDHDSLKVKKVDHNLRVRIMKARQDLNWSQQDLAQRISERATVVTEYESGKAIPEERVIVKMEKAFGMHLRGAKAGEPMGKIRPTPKPKD